MKLQMLNPRQGLQWVRLGLVTFWKQPLAITGLFFLFVFCFSLLASIRPVGLIASLVLVPCATLGLMLASQTVERGAFPMPAVLLAGLRKDAATRRQMLVLGAIYAALFLLVLGLSALVDGGSFASIYLGRGQLALSEEIVQSAPSRQAMWLSTLLYLPLTLMFWHAPALVYWHGVAPVKSLFFSFVACVRNWRALALFALGWMGVFTLVGLLLSALDEISGGAPLVTGMMFPAALMLAAVFFTSLYFSYRDCFGAAPPSAPTSAPPGPQPPAAS